MASFTASVMRRLSIFEQAFIVGIAAPLIALIFLQRTLRGMARGEMYIWTHAVDLYKSDLFLILSFVVFGLALLKVSKIRRSGLIVLQLLAMTLLVVEVVTHQFFIRTGAILDFNLIVLAITKFGETWWILRSETSIIALLIMLMLCVWMAFAPWGIVRLSIDDKKSADTVVSKNKLAFYFSVAAVLMLGAIMPPLTEPHIAFSRSSMINIVWTSTYPGQDMQGEDQQRPLLKNIKLKERSVKLRKKNVAIIVLESTRASSTSIYNNTFNTTPFLAELASKSIVAERAYSVVPHTSKALVAILCGTEPELQMQIVESEPNGIPSRCLADLLVEHGYETAFFQSATEFFEDGRQLVINMGYNYFLPVDEMSQEGYEQVNYFGFEDDIMLEPSRLWLNENSDRPFLTTYLTIIPHHNYTLPSDYKLVYYTSNDTYNRYLNGVNYLDRFVQKLLEQYKKLGVYEDTVFVFIGDHGEGFGEHGRFQHDNVIYEEGIHVPLVIYEPANPQGIKVENIVSQTDILPTLAELLDFDIVGGSLPGFAMKEIPDDRQLFAKCWYHRRCIASISQKYKYMHHFYDRPDELFDLEADPFEQINIADSHVDYINEVHQQMADWDATISGMYRRHQESLQNSN